MKKVFFTNISTFSKWVRRSVALLGGSVGGASSGKMLQSSFFIDKLRSKIQNRENASRPCACIRRGKKSWEKKETCISFVEKTRSEFCTIAKKQISLTNTTLKKKVIEITSKQSQSVKIKDVILEKEKDLKNIFQIKKSPRMLAIAFQSKIKSEKK